MSATSRPAIRSRHAAYHLRLIIEGAQDDASNYASTPEQNLGLHGLMLDDGFFTHARTRSIWERAFTSALRHEQARHSAQAWAEIVRAHAEVTEALNAA